jgi:hypothetical protein
MRCDEAFAKFVEMQLPPVLAGRVRPPRWPR